jgi:hypothetical protein
VTKSASGKQDLTAVSMFLAISRVTSFTCFLDENGSFSNTSIISFDEVPFIEATNVPFLPLPFLLVRNV